MLTAQVVRRIGYNADVDVVLVVGLKEITIGQRSPQDGPLLPSKVWASAAASSGV